MRIELIFDRKPIPDRRFDWEAIDADNYEPGMRVGHGPTPGDAVNDLLARAEETIRIEVPKRLGLKG